MKLNNKFIWTFSVFLLCLLFDSCARQGLTNETSNNPNFHVSLLFEYEGIKVYRFHDDCRYHYFTNHGECINTYSKLVGKRLIHYEENIK